MKFDPYNTWFLADLSLKLLIRIMIAFPADWPYKHYSSIFTKSHDIYINWTSSNQSDTEISILTLDLLLWMTHKVTLMAEVISLNICMNKNIH